MIHQEPRKEVDHGRRIGSRAVEGFSQGYELKDGRVSEKAALRIRRIELRDGTAYSMRPSFLMPYMTGRTKEVEGPLFLRKFGVPYWGLAYVFGRDAMYWYRLERALGRNSIVGTTVRKTELPEHLLASAFPIALSRLGFTLQLHSLEPRNGPREWRLEKPSRTPRQTPIS